jgi:hypothetical protein
MVWAHFSSKKAMYARRISAAVRAGVGMGGAV